MIDPPLDGGGRHHQLLENIAPMELFAKHAEFALFFIFSIRPLIFLASSPALMGGPSASGITSYRDTTLIEHSSAMQDVEKQQTPENQWFASHLKQPETAKNITLCSGSECCLKI